LAMPPAGSRLPEPDRISRGCPPSVVLSNRPPARPIAWRLTSRALRRRRARPPRCWFSLVERDRPFKAAEAGGELKTHRTRLAPAPAADSATRACRVLLGDLSAGLPLLSWRSYRSCAAGGVAASPLLSRSANPAASAAGFATVRPNGFVGNPEERTTPGAAGPGHNWPADRYHRAREAKWDPMEWALMGQRRCRVRWLVRDRTDGSGASAPWRGGPWHGQFQMMDGFLCQPVPRHWPPTRDRCLLAGSPPARRPGAPARLLGAAMEVARARRAFEGPGRP